MKSVRSLLLVVLSVSGAYLYTFPSATVLYFGGVSLHLGLGILLAILLAAALVPVIRRATMLTAAGWIFVIAGAALGVSLVFLGGAHIHQPWIYGHIALSAAGCAALVADRMAQNRARRLIYLAGAAVLALGLAVSAYRVREQRWHAQARIVNPPLPPETMAAEGSGSGGRFFPSSVKTSDGELIPSKYFMESESCKECHADIYEQWSSSMHRFSSFNNQWYRKSIEYMQSVAGVQSSKWCAGCHDPALLLSGMFDAPIGQNIDKPEAHAGLGCVGCHSIVSVQGTMGQGGYTIEYPALHELATSPNRYVRMFTSFLTRLNPEPHRRTFLKPFVTEQTAEFCSSCHKVHLDEPVNHYRWIRGFNDYDNWQASGVSGQGARSFYYPPKSQKCADCHMPQVPSRDAGNVNGMVHSHRFPGANTAVPFASGDATQLEVEEQFLKNKIVTVDIFAVSPARPVSEPPDARASVDGQLSTTFAVGEESDVVPVSRGAADVVPVSAPLDRSEATVRRGDDVRVDVVVRTRKVGHFFPGGTVDAFDVWVELVAEDDNGKVLFWSGKVDDGGKGPVEKGAHFYRSLQVDEHGNPINKRNAWSTRSLVYVRLIPPGAADTVHYRLRIPETAGDRIHLKAQLHYRKFQWFNTQFAYAGVRDPAQPNPPVAPGYDDGHWLFSGDTSKVSGKLKRIPDVPIVTLAESTATLRVLSKTAAVPEFHAIVDKRDWERWNDYGIGLFLQGDLRGAEEAFLKATETDAGNPDGWVNIGRVRVQEGNIAGAREVLTKALGLPGGDVARGHFFFARVLRAEGSYGEAMEQLRKVLAQYPRDRVALNDLGRILFLERRYVEAVRQFDAVLAVDPEDLQAHYNLMLCYNGLGQEDKALEHQKRYLRFKADESAQTITGEYRRAHPEDNNERQSIHEHASVPLGPEGVGMAVNRVGLVGK